MNKINFIYCSKILILVLLFCVTGKIHGETEAPILTPVVEISPGLKSGSFVEGALFEVPIVINTRDQSVNTIELHLKFDPKKIAVVNAFSTKSIIQIWIKSPTFNNNLGTEFLIGAIPNGIITDFGVIANITFRALAPGTTNISIDNNSLVLLNDGLGSKAKIETGTGQYLILPKPPGAVRVYSLTHSIQDRWYNNTNPVLNWDTDPEIDGFSFSLDDKPNSIPVNNVTTTSTTYGYQDIKDGIWYFHLKARKKSYWGETTHFQIRVDSQPPAKFKPSVTYLSEGKIAKALLIFSTTDRLSGIEHYEISPVDNDSPDTHAFVEVQSPYFIPRQINRNSEVIIRAIDNAGNVSDNYVNIHDQFKLFNFFYNNLILFLTTILLIIFFLIIFHYFITHKIISRFEKIYKILNKKIK